ncbi:ABC transporter permease [Mesorhizobium sp. 113-3-9]|uniref:ABC transporter permease n=1 Tax=Mesorhizobium sp. 113-3-9 TaxID=2744517 RepID=UPI0019260019|nr:ABC transporter permease [Mesorhizobium sp. 113-3-9]BCG83967.1 ABC transporter permease [Mesorhizobium sp. 113-3-9]
MSLQAETGTAVRASAGRIARTVRSSGVLDWAIVLALLILMAVGALASPLFLTAGNITSILVACSILVVVAIGQTFVIITAGIDLSVGSLVQISSVMIGISVTQKWGVPIGIVMAVVTGMMFGIISGIVISKGKISDFIATLGMLSIASGCALVLSNGRPVGVISPLLTQLASGSFGPIPNITLLAAVVAVIAHLLLFHTQLGTHLFAIGGNHEGSRNLGLKVARIKIAAFAISGLLAGIAGVMLTARIGSAEPATGSSYLLNSIAASVLGGTSLFGGRGTIIGPVVGALVLTALLNLMTLLGVGVFYQPIVTGMVVILFAIAYRFQK